MGVAVGLGVGVAVGAGVEVGVATTDSVRFNSKAVSSPPQPWRITEVARIRIKFKVFILLFYCIA